MSVVSNCILAFGIAEDEPARIAEVNTFFDPPDRFISADDESLPRGWYGGTKMLETPLYIAALNGFDESGFIEHLRTKVQWEFPECVQLIIKRQHDEVFSIVSPFASER